MKRLVVIILSLLLSVLSFSACTISCGDTSSNKKKYEPYPEIGGGGDEEPFSSTHSAFFEETTPTDTNYNTMPIININYNGSVSDTDAYTVCGVTLSGCKEGSEFSGVSAGIRLRGNATATFPKKSFRIKFDKKINIMNQGEGAAKSWVLLANYGDYSLMRDYLAYNMGIGLSNLRWSPSATFVNLYLNGEYNGVYLLCEQVSVSKARINIETGSDDVDTGYLIECDKWAKMTQNGKKDIEQNPGDYVEANKIPYAIKNQDEMSKTNLVNQLRYIEEYLIETDEAIYSHNKSEIEKYIDLPSFVDMYILQEYFKNIDCGWQFYMFKDKGTKLYMTAPWDFDSSVGNDSRLDNNNASWERLYVGELRTDPSRVGKNWGSDYYDIKPDNAYQMRNQWYIELMSCDWFKSLVKNRWNEINTENGLIDTVINQIDIIYNRYESDFNKNFTNKWNILGQPTHYIPQSVYSITTYSGQVNQLKTWLNNRRTWFNTYINTNA